MVAYGARSDSNALIQMRVHDVNVLTDLDAVNPLDPDPEEPVECDGTAEGGGEGIREQILETTQVPDESTLMNDVNTWWTGWWPRLHTKIDYTAADGAHVKYHVSNDLLGCLVVEEDLVVETNNANDPMESAEDPFTDMLVDVYLHSLVANAALEMAIATADMLCSIVCAGFEKHPAWWPAAAALGALWVAGFAVFVTASTNDVCSQTDDPFVRYWAIVLLGITVLYGWLVVDTVKDVGKYLVAGAGSISDFFRGMTTASLVWIAMKFLCMLVVFVWADVVLVLTLAGNL